MCLHKYRCALKTAGTFLKLCMGHKTKAKQKIRPYKKLLLLPYEIRSDGTFHCDEDGWKEQNKSLHHEMVTLAYRLNVYNNKNMIAPWLLRMQIFVKNNLPIYKKRLRKNEDIAVKLKTFPNCF